MLEELKIENYAVITEMNVTFGRGFNVITGPTGSGKTLMIDALKLSLGDRADYDVLRDSGETVIKSFFESNSLKQSDLPEEVFLERKLTQDRRSPAYLNGERVRLKELRSLRKDIIDLHGQHENQAVFDDNYPREVLDSFGDHDQFLNDYVDQYEQYRNKKKELGELESERNVDQRIEFLNHQVRELEQFDPSEGEWDEIEEKRRTLEDAEEIRESINKITDVLNGEISLSDQVRTLRNQLEKFIHATDRLHEWDDELSDVESILSEFGQQVKEVQSQINLDPDEIDQLMDRRGRWMELARKHNVAPEQLFDRFKSLQDELEKLKSIHTKKEDLRETIESLREDLNQLAEELHEARYRTAEELETKINNRLDRLRLEEASLPIEVKEAELGPYGCDDINWLYSPHPSQEPGPLEKRISGGEISRVLLAMKSAMAEADKIPVLVFDEIDVGISGEEADRVGRELARLANHHQIICITHLPLVAAHADHHIHVTRDDRSKFPDVHVERISNGKRVDEISRLLSGDSESDVSREQAKKLITDCS